MSTGPQRIGCKTPRSVKTTILPSSSVLSAVRTTVGFHLAPSPDGSAHSPSQVGLALRLLTRRRAHPRAPPIQVAVPRWNLVGIAH